MVVGSADRLQLQNELQFAGSINRCACRRENLDLQGYNVSIELLFLASAEMIDATLRLGNDSRRHSPAYDARRSSPLRAILRPPVLLQIFTGSLCVKLYDLFEKPQVSTPKGDP